MKNYLLVLICVTTIMACASDDDNGETTANPIPQDGLLAYYPFEGNANDASSNNHNGTVSDATLVSGRDGDVNSAYDFSAAESRIDLGDKDFFSGSGNTFSISAWIFLEAIPNRGLSIVSKLSQDNSLDTCGEFEEELFFGVNNQGILQFNYYENGATLSDRKFVVKRINPINGVPSTMPLNTWTHVAVTYNGNGALPNEGNNFVESRVQFYIDGQLKSSTVFQSLGIVNSNIEIKDRSAHLAIGNLIKSDGTVCNDRAFNGALDDVALYDKVLSAAEVTSLYEADAN